MTLQADAPSALLSIFLLTHSVSFCIILLSFTIPQKHIFMILNLFIFSYKCLYFLKTKFFAYFIVVLSTQFYLCISL